MISTLLPIAVTTPEEGLAYLWREAGGKDSSKAIAALNQAAALLEMLTGRKLSFRTYRDPVTIAGVGTQANEKALTMATTVAVKVGDSVAGTTLSPGSRVESIDSDVAITLNHAALADGSISAAFGSAPEVHDGLARDPWTWDRNDWPLYTNETPIVEVFAVKTIDSEGVATALSLTGMRLHKQSGAIFLPNAIVEIGRANVEIHYSAGLRWPSSTLNGKAEEVMIAQLATHRLAQAHFQDWANGPGRATETTLGGLSRRSPGFELPEDVKAMVQVLRRP